METETKTKDTEFTLTKEFADEYIRDVLGVNRPLTSKQWEELLECITDSITYTVAIYAEQ